jgi:hypothetical protein
MNTMPGFTAEDAIFKASTNYRTGGVFDSQTSPAYVRPAAHDSCLNLAIAFLNAPLGSFQEEVFITAYFMAGCGFE